MARIIEALKECIDFLLAPAEAFDACSNACLDEFSAAPYRDEGGDDWLYVDERHWPENDEHMPRFNTDGTPMIEGTFVDVQGHTYGQTGFDF